MESAAVARRPLMLLLLLLAAGVLSPSAVTVARARPTAVIVFGDSTVDTGNNDFWPTLARGNYLPYGRDYQGGRPTGRFCNGRMTPDFYSEMLGLGRDFVPPYLDPSYSIQDFAIGVNFASAGSGIDDATSNVVHTIPFTKQLDMFREYKSKLAAQFGAAKAEAVVSGAVYVISTGGNDFGENYFAGTTPRPFQYPLPQYVAYLMGLIRSFLTDLHALGARKVGFVGFGPLGCYPPNRVFFAGLCNEFANVFARGFNQQLENMMAQLRGQLPDADFRVADPYDFFNDVMHQPAKYGFSRVDVGCCGPWFCFPFQPACPDANAYYFYDVVHQTEHANRLLAAYLVNTTYGPLSS